MSPLGPFPWGGVVRRGVFHWASWKPIQDEDDSTTYVLVEAGWDARANLDDVIRDLTKVARQADRALRRYGKPAAGRTIIRKVPPPEDLP